MLHCKIADIYVFVQVIGLTTSIGVIKGTNNELLAIGLVFSLVV